MEPSHISPSPSSSLPHYHILDYLTHKEIYQIYNLNQTFQAELVKVKEELEVKYEKYYNMNKKQKLNDVLSILASDALTYPNNRASITLSDVLYGFIYGKLIDKILQLNRIRVFKCPLNGNDTQVCSIIQQMTYSKSLVIIIQDDNDNDMPTKDNTAFTSVLHCIKNQMHILLDVSITFDTTKNSFGYVNGIDLFIQSVKTKPHKQFLNYQKLFYSLFNDSISSIKMYYADFNTTSITNMLNSSTINNSIQYKVHSFELTLAFDPHSKHIELEHCMNYLSQIIVSPKIKIISYKAIDYVPICDFLNRVKPLCISLTPIKDVDSNGCIAIMNLLSSSSYLLHSINLVNIISFPYDSLEKVLKTQSQLINLRIGGMLTEDVMRKIICFYLDSGNEGKYQLKHLSLNGRIDMNREWSDLICKVLKEGMLFESFHIDCFFDKETGNGNGGDKGKEYMKQIANAFYRNETMKSFTIRNSVRFHKDEFIDVLKGVLKEHGLSREDQLKKFKRYAII